MRRSIIAAVLCLPILCTRSTFAAISFVGGSVGAVTGSGPWTFTWTNPSSGMAIGEFILLVLRHGSADTFTGPTGFVHLCQTQSQTADLYYRTATSADTNSAQYTASDSTASTNLGGLLRVYSGEYSPSPIDSYDCAGNATSGIGSGSGTALNNAALDTMWGTDQYIAGYEWGIGNTATLFTSPGDLGNVVQATSAPKTWSGDKAVSTTPSTYQAAIKTEASVSQSPSDTWDFWVIALKTNYTPSATGAVCGNLSASAALTPTQEQNNIYDLDVYGGCSHVQCTGKGRPVPVNVGSAYPNSVNISGTYWYPGHPNNPPNPHFYLEELTTSRGKQWAICDPLGNAGFYNLQDVVNYDANGLDVRSTARYSTTGHKPVQTAAGFADGFLDWAVNQVQRLRDWGFVAGQGNLLDPTLQNGEWNAITGADETLPIKLPHEEQLIGDAYMLATGHGCTTPVKSLTINRSANTFPLASAFIRMADYWDPNVQTCIANQIASQLANYLGTTTAANTAPHGDYWLYANADESDWLGWAKNDPTQWFLQDASFSGAQGNWCWINASSTTLTCNEPETIVTNGEAVQVAGAGASGGTLSTSAVCLSPPCTGTTVTLNAAASTTVLQTNQTASSGMTAFGSNIIGTSFPYVTDSPTHAAWAIVASDPIQNLLVTPYPLAVHVIYTDHTNYSKLNAVNLLADEYICTGNGVAVNGANCCGSSGTASCTGICAGAGTGAGSVDPASASYFGSANIASGTSALNTAWSSHYTTLGTSDSTDCGSNLGTCLSSGTYAPFGDHLDTFTCSGTSCSGTLSHTTVNEGAGSGYCGYQETTMWADAASTGAVAGCAYSGSITGSGYFGGGDLLSGGSLTDSTGAFTLNFSSSLSSRTIYVTYRTQAGSTGTGLLDEDGTCPSRGGNPCWMGDSSSLGTNGSIGAYTGTSSNAETSAMKADMNMILGAYVDQFASKITAAFHSQVPGILLKLEAQNPTGPTRGKVLTELAKYFDFIQTVTPTPLCTAAAGCTDDQTRLNYIGSNYGDYPLEDFPQITGNVDSTQQANSGNGFRVGNWTTSGGSACGAGGASSCVPGEVNTTQALHGAAWATFISNLLNAKPASTNSYPLIGSDTYAYADGVGGYNWAFGLVTQWPGGNGVTASPFDNAYDGHCSVNATAGTVSDPWGYPCGGEAANYGDYVDPVAAANASIYPTLFFSAGAPAAGGLGGPLGFW